MGAVKKALFCEWCGKEIKRDDKAKAVSANRHGPDGRLVRGWWNPAALHKGCVGVALRQESKGER